MSERDTGRTEAPRGIAEEGAEGMELDLMVLLADFFKGLKKYWWLVLLLTAAVPLTMLLRGVRTYRPQYRAEATFTVATRITTSYGSDDFSSNYDYGTVTQMARTFPYILNSDILQQMIQEDLDVPSLNGSISADGLEDTNLFVLSVTGPDPSDALRILHSAIANYPKVAEFIIGDTKLHMLSEPSVVPVTAGQPTSRRTIARNGLAGLAAGLALVALYALMRRTVRKADDIRTKLNQKSLGVLPRVVFKRRSSKAKQRLNLLNRQVSSAYKESMRGLRSRVVKAMEETGAKVLLVTSTLKGEGKSTLSLNLALSMAQRGARVALLDADLRRQDIHNLLGLKEPPATLLQALRGEVKREQAVFELFVRGFHYVPCGLEPEKSVEMLRMPAFAQAVEDLKRNMDYVIIDTPPAGMLADASALAEVSDCMLYVIRQDLAHLSRVIDGLQGLADTGVPMLGCVLNDAAAGFTGYGYGYGYGYGGRYAYGYGGRYAYGRYGNYGEEEERMPGTRREADTAPAASRAG